MRGFKPKPEPPRDPEYARPREQEQTLIPGHKREDGKVFAGMFLGREVWTDPLAAEAISYLANALMRTQEQHRRDFDVILGIRKRP